MGRKSSRKGAKAERDIAAKLQEWWSQYEQTGTDGKPIVFVRTPRSGGWIGARAAFKACGDVMTNAPSFPFVVEVKRREGWSFENWRKNPTDSPVRGWWEQACAAADEQGGIPMLLFRRNRSKWLVLIPSHLEGAIGLPTWKVPYGMHHHVSELSDYVAGYFFGQLLRADPGGVLKCAA